MIFQNLTRRSIQLAEQKNYKNIGKVITLSPGEEVELKIGIFDEEKFILLERGGGIKFYGVKERDKKLILEERLGSPIEAETGKTSTFSMGKEHGFNLILPPKTETMELQKTGS